MMRKIPYNPTNPNIGGCKGTRFGCCPDSNIACSDKNCNNCLSDSIVGSDNILAAGPLSNKSSSLNGSNINQSNVEKYTLNQRKQNRMKQKRYELDKLKNEAEKIHDEFLTLKPPCNIVDSKKDLQQKLS